MILFSIKDKKQFCPPKKYIKDTCQSIIYYLAIYYILLGQVIYNTFFSQKTAAW